MQQLNADYNAKFGFPFILAVRGPRGLGLAQGRDHRHLRAAARQPPRLRTRRVPAQHPPHRRDPPGRQVRPCARTRQSGLGLGRASGGQQRPRLCRARRAHRDLPDRRAPRLSRNGWRTGCAPTAASTRSRSMRSATSSASITAATATPSACSPAATTTPCATAASTTGAWASSCRWPACASCTARAGACRSASRSSASPKKKASATRRCSSARAR